MIVVIIIIILMIIVITLIVKNSCRSCRSAAVAASESAPALTGVCEKNTYLKRTFALQRGSRNCDPEHD